MPHGPPSVAVALHVTLVLSASARYCCAMPLSLKMPPWPIRLSTVTPSRERMSMPSLSETNAE